MPGVITNRDESRKRKRAAASGPTEGASARKAPKQTASASADDTQARISLLEEQILESSKHYKNIEELLVLVSKSERKPKSAILAAIALCRAFSRLIAAEKLLKTKDTSEKEAQLVQWLRARLHDYVETICAWTGSPDATQESTAITLLMRIVKEEATGASKSAEQSWRNKQGTFHAMVRALLQRDGAEGGRQEFVDKFAEEYDDVRYYTLVAIKQDLQEAQSETTVSNAIALLAQIEGIPESEDQLEDWYGEAPEEKSPLLSLNAHRKAAREAWLAIFKSPLSSEQRKKLLGITTTRILPWFVNQLELLADFLTDSFNHGGSVSLLALSGIFSLMTQKNLDYPDFYTKLYSLLDEDVLHSKQRSRFFRLLETFMSSTHLPAAMVASFIKRLSRLALQAPPAAIVWIVPWVYNQLKQHPSCTFMLHRTYHPAHEMYSKHPRFEEEGMDDPFDMKQIDPSHTGATDSSLWELETLRNHYQPNVATLAKIIGEQFTKRDYQLEDFLNHSYDSLIDAELGKGMKKTPVVEWDIPKRIVTLADGELNGIGQLLESALQASRG